MAKHLKDIKHGNLVIDSLEVGKFYFVYDIRRKTGLDPKSLRSTMNALLKHGFLGKTSTGQWELQAKAIVRGQADTESAVAGGTHAPASESNIIAL